MHKIITRGLALATVTGAFTLLGATAANAIDIGGGDDNGGLLGGIIDIGGSGSDGDLLGDLNLPIDVQVPVNIDGLTVDALGSQDGIGSLGDGILADTGSSNADILGNLGIDTSDVLGDADALTAVVGVPLDLSNTWVSILGNDPDGVAVVPNLSGGPTATVDGLLDAFVDVPVNVTCSSITVISDYENECAGESTPGESDGGSDSDTDSDGGLLDGGILDGILDGGALGGGLLDGDLLDLDDLTADLPITLDDQQIDVLDGDILDGVLEEDGVDVDFGDSTLDPGTSLGLDFVDAVVGAPIDLSNAWVTAFGENGGLVVVPDLTIDASVLTGGIITSEILAPITIDCVTVTVLSDYERDCGTSVIDEFPTDPETPVTPTDPTDPTTPTDVDGTDNGGNTGTDEGDALDPCAVVPTSATTGLSADSSDSGLGMLAMGALAGGLVAMGLLVLGRKFGTLQ